MKRFKDEIHKIKIVALFDKETKSYTPTGMSLYEHTKYLVIKCHERYYELDISPLPFELDQKIFHIEEIDSIKSYIYTKTKCGYAIYIANNQELEKYNKKIKVGNKDYFSDSILLANISVVIDCEEDMLLMLDRRKFDLFKEEK